MDYSTSHFLASLPTELAQAVLSFSPDSFTLRALVLSASSFYRTFLTAQNLILNAVLHNEHAGGVLPDAMAALMSSHVQPRNKKEIGEFLFQYQPHLQLVPESWSLSDSLKLSRIRRSVRYFAGDYAATLALNPVTGVHDEHPKTLTRTEMDRIERALYRFEVLCNLFRTTDIMAGIMRGDMDEQQHLFLRKFAPWENEQLGCIYHYLWSRLSIPFNDVAEHDIEWGERSIPYSNMNERDDNDYTEWCLSFGLEWLHKLVTASTYNERYQMFLPWLSTNCDFMGSMLFRTDTVPLPTLVSIDDFGERRLVELSEEDQFKILNTKFANDPDRGPLEAWRWAYQELSVTHLCYRLEQEQLRERGYVMFDFDRLYRWNIFSTSFDTQAAYKDWWKRRRETDNGLYERMIRSWGERSKIWLRGGRGWWSEGDESKLIWPYRK